MAEPLRVLHLEDDSDFSELVKAMLQKEGLEADLVVVATTPDFLAALEKGGFDIILADYLLPTCNGIQALEAARQKRPETPFLLVSGAIGEHAAIESLRCGATDYVLKSKIERLVPAVCRAVQEARERMQRKRAETELLRREKYFRTLTENSLDVLTILNRDGNFLYNSPSLKTVLGYEPKELIGRNAFELIHPEDLPATLRVFEEALGHPERRITHELRYRRRDGSWCHLEVVGQNRLDDPEIAGVVLNTRDICDRKRAAAELRESEQQYRLIFDGSPTPMWVSDEETYAFLEVNEAAIQHYGYSREEFLAMTGKDIRPPEDVPKLAKYFADVVRHESATRIGRAGLWRHRKKDGALIDVEIKWSKVTFKGRAALLTMVNDVTERKRTEQRGAALSRLSRHLSSATSPAAAAQVIQRAADDLFNWDLFALVLYSAETGTLRPVLKIDTVGGRREEIPVGGTREKPGAIARRVIQSGAELILDSEAVSAKSEKGLFGAESRPPASVILAPIRSETKVIGILSIQSYTSKAYGQPDLSALQILADHCGGALERLHAEQALRESESRFRELFEGSPDGILVADLNGCILDVNPAVCRLQGATREKLIGRNVTALAPAEREQQVMSNLGNLVAGVLNQVEGLALTEEGRRIPVEIRGNCIEYGDRQALLLHVRDITERQQAAEALQKSEASLAAAQRIAHLGSWELDLQDSEDIHNHELRWSEETYRIFGYEPRQVAVTKELFFKSAHPEDRQRIMNAVDHAVRNREPYDLEHRILLPSGEERIVRERGEPAFDSSGKPTQMRGIVMDVTERRRLEEQLRQSQKMEAIGQLAGGVAHDFNNILTVIHGHASLLLADKKSSDHAVRSAEQISQAAGRAAGLTRQLLAFSRRQVLQPRRLDLNQVVSNLTMMLGRILGEDIALQLNYWPEPAFVQADASMIE